MARPEAAIDEVFVAILGFLEERLLGKLFTVSDGREGRFLPVGNSNMAPISSFRLLTSSTVWTFGDWRY